MVKKENGQNPVNRRQGRRGRVAIYRVTRRLGMIENEADGISRHGSEIDGRTIREGGVRHGTSRSRWAGVQACVEEGFPE